MSAFCGTFLSGCKCSVYICELLTLGGTGSASSPSSGPGDSHIVGSDALSDNHG